MQVVDNVSGALRIKLGVRKCAVAHMRAGKIWRLGVTSRAHNNILIS